MTDLQKAKLREIQDLQLKIKALINDDAFDSLDSADFKELNRFERKARIALVDVQDAV